MYNSDFGRKIRSQYTAKSPSKPKRHGHGHGHSESFSGADGIASSSTERLAQLMSGPASTSGPSDAGGAHATGSSSAEGDRVAEAVASEVAGSGRRSRQESHPSDRPQTPSKRSHAYADRYVPAREGLDGQSAAFQMLDRSPSTPHRPKRKQVPDLDAEQEEADNNFSTLLGSEIFGHDVAASGSSSSAPSSGSRSSSRAAQTTPSTPSRKNLFTYSSPSSASARSRTPQRGRDDSMRLEKGIASATPRNSASLFGTAKKNGNGTSDSLDSPSHRAYNTSPVRPESQRMLLSPRRAPRTVSKAPFKVLDAPELSDDFYLNLVDWSSTDTLGVGLDKCVYLWSAKDANVQKLVDLEASNDRVTSLSWAGRGTHIAVGTSNGLVQIWDAEQLQLLRTMRGHDARVGALTWNEQILSSGSRDRTIYHRDVRMPEHHVAELHGHKQEVCNLEWNTEANQLASGGNDNKVLVWDALNTTPLHRFTEHKAAVKALAWSPHQQGILATGGGTADMKIRFWNTITGTLLSEVDTGSQVCNLMWSRTANEIISTHGYSSGKVQNQVQLWRYPSMQQIATLTGHTMRVLYLAMSPDGETIVTGAGDETLRFWDLNSPSRGQKGGSGQNGVLSPFAKLR